MVRSSTAKSLKCVPTEREKGKEKNYKVNSTSLNAFLYNFEIIQNLCLLCSLAFPTIGLISGRNNVQNVAPMACKKKNIREENPLCSLVFYIIYGPFLCCNK